MSVLPSTCFPLTGNRSRDIPLTPTDLNNIHFNRFQNEFHYFSRFHGNSCPAGKYISLAHPPPLDKSSFLFLTPSNANTSRTCQVAGTLLCCSSFLLFSVTHASSLSFSLFFDLLSTVSPSRLCRTVCGISDFYRFAPFMFIRWNKAPMGSLLAMKLKSCLSSGGIRAHFSFAS